MNLNFLQNKSTGVSLLILSLIVITSTMIFSAIGYLLSGPIFGVSCLEFSSFDLSNSNIVNSLKFIQLLNSIGIFLVPSIIFSLIFSNNPRNYLLGENKININSIIYVILITILTIPFINWINEVNGKMKLPDFLYGLEEWMKKTENQAEQLTKAFVNVKTFHALLINIFVMAIVPAICEEIFFRSVIQQQLCKLFKNTNIAILLTAAIFSILHFQFYGFLPRFLLGILFGYLFFWSNSLWLPITAHFINNSITVIWYFYMFNTLNTSNIDKFNTILLNPFVILISLILCIAIIYIFFINSYHKYNFLKKVK